ncbi:MAG: hypothetical protein K0S38_487 [Candidatus Paceibacter sp.]|nr:hypothetical protein [Candidatus Paceibacter sp.]
MAFLEIQNNKNERSFVVKKKFWTGFGITIGIAIVVMFFTPPHISARIGGSIIALCLFVGVLFVLRYLVLMDLFAAFAEENYLFSRREDGKIRYITKGGRLIGMIAKIDGHTIVQRTITEIEKVRENNVDVDTEVKKEVYRIVPNAQVRKTELTLPSGIVLPPDRIVSSNKETLSEYLWGVPFIGFPASVYQIKRYTLNWKRPIRPQDNHLDEDRKAHYTVDKEHEIVSRSDETDYHLWRSVYSIFIENIEIKAVKMTVEGTDGKPKEIEGTVRINFSGTFTLVTVDPYKPVMELDGQWFPHIEDGIKGIVSDFFSGWDIDQIRNMPKATAANKSKELSDLEQRIVEFSDAPGGTIKTTGLRIEAFNYAGFDITDEDFIKAVRERGLAQLKAAARKEQGLGEKEFFTLVGQGEAAAITAKATALGENVLLTYLLSEQAKSEGIKQLKGTYVEAGRGGRGRNMMLSLPATPTNPTPLPPSDPAKPETPPEQGENQGGPGPEQEPAPDSLPPEAPPSSTTPPTPSTPTSPPNPTPEPPKQQRKGGGRRRGRRNR